MFSNRTKVGRFLVAIYQIIFSLHKENSSSTVKMHVICPFTVAPLTWWQTTPFSLEFAKIKNYNWTWFTINQNCFADFMYFPIKIWNFDSLFRLGCWQFMTEMPYHTVTTEMSWQLLWLFHQDRNQQINVDNLPTEEVCHQVIGGMYDQNWNIKL